MTKIKSTDTGKNLRLPVDTRLNIKIRGSSNCKRGKPHTGVHWEEHGQQAEGSDLLGGSEDLEEFGETREGPPGATIIVRGTCPVERG